jgi:hypothetical protein
MSDTRCGRPLWRRFVLLVPRRVIVSAERIGLTAAVTHRFVLDPPAALIEFGVRQLDELGRGRVALSSLDGRSSRPRPPNPACVFPRTGLSTFSRW